MMALVHVTHLIGQFVRNVFVLHDSSLMTKFGILRSPITGPFRLSRIISLRCCCHSMIANTFVCIRPSCTCSETPCSGVYVPTVVQLVETVTSRVARTFVISLADGGDCCRTGEQKY